jgi:DNA-binding CsgD family transcriptional regulator
MSNVFNLKVSATPSKFIKGEQVVKHEPQINTDQATKTLDNFNETAVSDQTILNIYKPVVIILLVIFLIVIAYQFFIILRLREKDKLDEHKVSLNRYDAQQVMLENELRSIQESNKKLEKEIDEKEKEQKKIALSIIRKNEILSKLKAEIEKIKSKPEDKLKYSDLNTLKVLILDNLSLEKERKSLDRYIKELNESFFQNLEKKYPGLTENEKKLCSLLRLKLTSKEISSILNITPKSVEVSRYRLRKKMKIGKDEKLTKVIRKL